MKNKLIISILLNLLLTFTLVESQPANDLYQITLNYKKQLFAESLSLVNIHKINGLIQQNPFEPIDGYRLEIISNNNQISKSMKFSIPTTTVVLKGFGNNDAQGSPDDLNFTISIPYFSNAKTINIH